MAREIFSKDKVPRGKTALGRSLIITVIYIIFGCAWILMSDSLADIMITDRSNLLMVSTIKGLVYVALTALLIFTLTYPAFKKIIAARNNLQNTNGELEKANRELTLERNKLLATEQKQKETEENLQESQRSKTVLLENVPGMVYRCLYDRSWTMQYVSNGCQQLTGYLPDSLVGNRELTFKDLIVPKYRDYLWDKWTQTLKQRTHFTDEYEITAADGSTKWVWEQGQGVYNSDGSVSAIEGLIIDISPRKEQEYRLVYLSEHNEISGLFNRHKCEELLPILLEQCGGAKKAFMLLELEKYNLLHITHGYRYGEMLIYEIAEKLKAYITSYRFLFHISSDRFAFFVADYNDLPELFEFSADIMANVDELLAANNISCSIGIMEINEFGIEPASIIKYASIAAEYKEVNQKRHIHVFNREMEESVRRRETILNELTDCAKKEEDNRLFLEYQPIIHTKNGHVQGYEALARFSSTAYGRISPLEFIPIAEETQLIVPLGRKIMRDAMLFLKSIINEGYDDIVISVNVSAIQLLRDDFLPDLMQLISEIGITPYNLCLEITESYFADNYNEINEKLNRIRNMGVSVALDDFGVGYSSLARERELKVDCLKIDKYFIDKLLQFEPHETITSDIISMAHKIGHCVVAEGVEEERQKRYLVEHQCDYLQGYLFSRPMSTVDALCFLRNNKRL